MAPSESSILSNLLLQPAPLPAVISLQTFTDLVAKGQQNNASIKSLYRDLKHERGLDIEQVRRNIKQECNRGERQRRQVIKARRQSEKLEISRANPMGPGMVDEVFYSVDDFPKKESLHTLSSILPEMEQACADLEADIAASGAESETILKDLGITVGNLSDLKYGRFGKPDSTENLRQDVLEGLWGLDKACKAKYAG